MNLTVISHACAVPINQQLYAEVERHTGWNITIIYPSNWRDDYGRSATSQRWEGFGGNLIGLPVWKPGNIILHAYRASLKRLFRQTRPDAIYVHHEPYAVATAQAYWANARSVNCPIGFYTAQNILKSYPLPFRWSERIVHRRTSYCFPVTQAIDDVLRARGYGGHSTILPLGVDPAIYQPRTEAVQIKKRLQRAGADEILIGYVGRVTEEKGLLMLAKALRHLRQSPARAWRLVVVGCGPFEQEFARVINEFGVAEHVTRIGAIPHHEMPLYYSALDIVVVPSETRPRWKEQFGRVIVEALACGAAVVGSDSGEIPHLIGDLEGGLIFPEANPIALAEQLRTLIEDEPLRERLVQQGQSAVSRRYTNASLALKFAQTVQRAVETAAQSRSNAMTSADEPMTVTG